MQFKENLASIMHERPSPYKYPACIVDSISKNTATKSSVAALFLATILLLAAASAFAQAPAPGPSSSCPLVSLSGSGSLTLSQQTALQLSIQPIAIQIQCLCNAAGGVTSLARIILDVLQGFLGLGVSGLITIDALNCTIPV
jgi:hypothetical protein